MKNCWTVAVCCLLSVFFGKEPLVNKFWQHWSNLCNVSVIMMFSSSLLGVGQYLVCWHWFFWGHRFVWVHFLRHNNLFDLTTHLSFWFYVVFRCVIFCYYLVISGQLRSVVPLIVVTGKWNTPCPNKWHQSTDHCNYCGVPC